MKPLMLAVLLLVPLVTAAPARAADAIVQA
jgi:hypothetical protein